jgi:hypothetical protein
MTKRSCQDRSYPQNSSLNRGASFETASRRSLALDQLVQFSGIVEDHFEGLDVEFVLNQLTAKLN